MDLKGLRNVEDTIRQIEEERLVTKCRDVATRLGTDVTPYNHSCSSAFRLIRDSVYLEYLLGKDGREVLRLKYAKILVFEVKEIKDHDLGDHQFIAREPGKGRPSKQYDIVMYKKFRHNYFWERKIAELYDSITTVRSTENPAQSAN